MKRTLMLLGLSMAGPMALAADNGPDGLRVIGPDAIASAWTPEASVAPVYPSQLADRGVTGCVTLTYMIGSDGRVSRINVLDGRASARSPLAARLAVERFAGAGATALSVTRFVPSGDAQPTLTATTLHFGETPSAESSSCEGTRTARLLDGGSEWAALIGAAYERDHAVDRMDRLASTNSRGRGGEVVRATDSPWDGTTGVILSPPTVITGGR